MKKLTKAVKKRWINELRSDKYQQSTGSLKDKDGYCCLGVLCDIVDKKGWGRIQRGSYRHHLDHSGDHIDINDTTPALHALSLGSREKLVKLNDDKNYSFKRIATWIEKNL